MLFIIFGLVPFAIALILTFGGRDIIAGVLAGYTLKRIYTEGDKIESKSFSGKVESIDFITTRLSSAFGEIIIPNSELAKAVVKKEKHK